MVAKTRFFFYLITRITAAVDSLVRVPPYKCKTVFKVCSSAYLSSSLAILSYQFHLEGRKERGFLHRPVTVFGSSIITGARGIERRILLHGQSFVRPSFNRRLFIYDPIERKEREWKWSDNRIVFPVLFCRNSGRER